LQKKGVKARPFFWLDHTPRFPRFNIEEPDCGDLSTLSSRSVAERTRNRPPPAAKFI